MAFQIVRNRIYIHNNGQGYDGVNNFKIIKFFNLTEYIWFNIDLFFSHVYVN